MTAQVRIPQHVVYRSFAQETVMLNLQTGTYHGLNASAGKMVEALDRAASVGAAVATVAAAYDVDAERVRRDITTLCVTLADAGLVELRLDGREH